MRQLQVKVVKQLKETYLLKYSFDTNCLKELKNSFQYLEEDPYLKTKTRFRSYASFFIDNDKLTRDENPKPFTQYVDDPRSQPRVFPPMKKQQSQNPIYRDIMLSSVKTICPSVKKFQVSVHQVRLLCQPNSTATNTPEGIHKDGVKYIVSALIINAENYQGGVSRVFQTQSPDTLIYQHRLIEGEAMLMNDENYFHDATSIESVDKQKVGIRDLIGLDFTPLE